MTPPTSSFYSFEFYTLCIISNILHKALNFGVGFLLIVCSSDSSMLVQVFIVCSYRLWNYVTIIVLVCPFTYYWTWIVFIYFVLWRNMCLNILMQLFHRQKIFFSLHITYYLLFGLLMLSIVSLFFNPMINLKSLNALYFHLGHIY